MFKGVMKPAPQADAWGIQNRTRTHVGAKRHSGVLKFPMCRAIKGLRRTSIPGWTTYMSETGAVRRYLILHNTRVP